MDIGGEDGEADRQLESVLAAQPQIKAAVLQAVDRRPMPGRLRRAVARGSSAGRNAKFRQLASLAFGNPPVVFLYNREHLELRGIASTESRGGRSGLRSFVRNAPWAARQERKTPDRPNALTQSAPVRTAARRINCQRLGRKRQAVFPVCTPRLPERRKPNESFECRAGAPAIRADTVTRELGMCR